MIIIVICNKSDVASVIVQSLPYNVNSVSTFKKTLCEMDNIKTRNIRIFYNKMAHFLTQLWWLSKLYGSKRKRNNKNKTKQNSTVHFQPVNNNFIIPKYSSLQQTYIKEIVIFRIIFSAFLYIDTICGFPLAGYTLNV